MLPALVDIPSDEEFIQLVKDSDSIIELCKKLGYRAHSGSNNTRINERIKKLKVSTDHFSYGHRTPTKRNFENIFCEYSTASQSTLRKHYVIGNYSEYKCSICGQPPFWNGKELTLTLDHINGNNHDNRLENLRWVCPNCDRQLPTFGTKNIPKKVPKERAKGRCKNCGKPISIKANYCIDCYSIIQRKAKRPTKEQLERELRETNFCQVGKKYGVSNNAVKKWCKAYGLPTRASDYR